MEGAVLGAHAFVLRFLRAGADDRLLLVNLGVELALDGMAEPLLAPPAGQRWRMIWSSEDPRYGGAGTPELEEAWRLPAETTLVLAPEPSREAAEYLAELAMPRPARPSMASPLH